MAATPKATDNSSKIDSGTDAEYRETGDVHYHTDAVPAEYHNRHGRMESDVAHSGHVYPAIVTAHFPDDASADRAIEEIDRLDLQRNQAVQVFREYPGGRDQPGLEIGEAAIIVQLDRPEQGQEVLRICEAAGALHSNFYPEQSLGKVADGA